VQTLLGHKYVDTTLRYARSPTRERVAHLRDCGPGTNRCKVMEPHAR